ncbi:TRAP transporter large permease [Desulfopila aestuarii]|uniref:C4-dicarboxylate transporter, DctM subunit n=1 Tax=Desulfopila aestuarii DSM 18488 TaxID=1121416 RepID=A0A1M7XYJ3_9BACT|nr:TRAP transporter large permease subunit [Desulfopila aestuarii]SHO44125.1 C4-dicarboxylate transporter, DctM subunit [Desulfopila aestuarii DSM 18488]
MLTFMVCLFVILLVISTPIAIIMLAVTGATLFFYLGIPLQALVQQLFNGMDNFILLAIPFFILAGNIMAQGSISRKLVNVMQLVVGRVPGGMAISSVLACVFFAAISGSSPATVIAIGSIMIPALIKHGHDEDFSIGLLTSAGSMGILIPPSIPMVLYALVMNVSVGKMFMAGFMPGLLIGGLLIVYSVILSKKHGWGAGRTYAKGERWAILLDASWGCAMPVLVLGGIYSGVFTPTEAAAVSVIYALLVEFFIYKDMDLKKFNKILRDSVILSSALLFIIACAMTFIWLLTRETIPQIAADFLTTHIQNKYVFLFIINIFLLLIGCVMDIVSAIIVISPILLIALEKFDIDLIHYGIIMIVNIELGFLTFPFGLNLFVAMGITGKSLTQIGRAVMPFLALLIVGLMMVTYIPTISLWLPSVL